MSYKTAQGRTVEYPMSLAAKMAKAGKLSADDIGFLVDASHKIFRELQNLDLELITLRQDNQRLKAENEFMLRLINSRDDVVAK